MKDAGDGDVVRSLDLSKTRAEHRDVLILEDLLGFGHVAAGVHVSVTEEDKRGYRILFDGLRDRLNHRPEAGRGEVIWRLRALFLLVDRLDRFVELVDEKVTFRFSPLARSSTPETVAMAPGIDETDVKK